MSKKLKMGACLLVAMVFIATIGVSAVGLQQAGSAELKEGTSISEFVATEKYAFVKINDDLGHLGGSEIHVYDVSDPSTVTYVTKIYRPVLPGYTQAMAVSNLNILGDYLIFVANKNGNYGTSGAVVAVKLSDISSSTDHIEPITVAMTNGAPTLKVSDKAIYILDPNGTLMDIVFKYVIDGENRIVRESMDYADATKSSEFSNLDVSKQFAFLANAAGTGYNVYNIDEYANLTLPESLGTIAMPTNGYPVSEFVSSGNDITYYTRKYPDNWNVRNEVYVFNITDAAGEDGIIPARYKKNYFSGTGRIMDVSMNGGIFAVMAQDLKKVELLNMKTYASYSLFAPEGISAYGGYIQLTDTKLIYADWYKGIKVYTITGT